MDDEQTHVSSSFWKAIRLSLALSIIFWVVLYVVLV